MAHPFLSIVIPTKNRAATVVRTIEALTEQRTPAGGMELIVVDDRSSDSTLSSLRTLAARGPLPLSVLRGNGRGPASARNAGVAAAVGEIVLFLGDDTRPAEVSLLERHAGFHRLRPQQGYAVLGRVTWDDAQSVTPFMHWLECGGPQFAYHRLARGAVDASSYFYTAHVSLKRELFERAGGFDERFPGAAVEDLELGVRLEKLGTELDYQPDLLVLHDHATSLARSLARTEAIGRSSALYNHLHPERPHPGIKPARGLRWRLLRIAAPALAAGRRGVLPEDAVRPAWRMLHLAAYERGYRHAEAERGGAGRASGPHASRASSSRRPTSPSS